MSVPWRNDRRCRYFVLTNRWVETLSYAEAVMIAADPDDRRKVHVAYTTSKGVVVVDRAGARFTALAKRAIRSAQEREENPPCDASTAKGYRCKVVSVTTWRDLHVCAMHDPEGKFCADNPVFKRRTLEMLRVIKKAEVVRLEDRLTALLLERFGPSKGRGIIGV